MAARIHRLRAPRNLHLLLVLAATLSILLLLPSASAQGTTIIDPRWSHPSAILQGEEVTVRVACPSPPTEVYLISPSYNESITSFDITREPNAFSLKFRPGAPKGVYDIFVKCGDEEALSPKSLVIFDAWPSKIRIAQISDTHIGLTLDTGRASDSYLVEAILLSMILGSDIVIHTGDTVDVGAMSKDYATLYKVMNSFGVPAFVVPGNHDYSGDSTLSNYGQFVGKSVYQVRWGPFLFIGLDTGYYGRLTPQQLDFLQGALEENRDAPVKIVFFHHPVFNTKLVGRVNGSPRELISNSGLFYPSWREAPDITARFLELVDAYGINLVLSGHTHADGLVLYNGKTLFVTTVTTGGGVREGDYRGLKLVDVYQNGTINVIPRPGASLFDPTIAFNLDRTSAYYRLESDAFVFLLEGDDPDIPSAVNEKSRIWLRLPFNTAGAPELKIFTRGENVDYTPDLSNALEPILSIHNMKEKFKILVAIAKADDTIPPEVSIAQVKPSKPIAGRDRLEVIINAVDKGWGLKAVYLEYRLPTGGTHQVLAFPYLEDYYSAKLPLLPTSVSTLEFRAIAIDLSEHLSSTDWARVDFVVPTTTAQTATAPTTSSTSPVTQTTGSPITAPTGMTSTLPEETSATAPPSQTTTQTQAGGAQESGWSISLSTVAGVLIASAILLGLVISRRKQ